VITAKTLLITVLALILAPFVGALVAGLDRKITARVQSRVGPPVLQPIYDVMKLFGKQKMVVNAWQIFSAWMYVASAAIALALFFLQSDLLLIFFVLLVGSVFLVMGALAAPSPYSQVGAQRELLQMLTYEPLLVLVFVSIYLTTGSFNISAVYAQPQPLLFKLPLMFVVLGYVLTIKLRKSPFDISTCHHAHQEIVKGVTTEYSGPYLALIEVAHFYETVLLLGLVSLFWATSLPMMIALVVATYLAEIWIDNVMARMTWRWMLKYVLSVGFGLSFVNMIWLYAS
jgi:ech hydrogenase subunit B